jgi:AhpD family alkylhydroperoxidase
VLESPGVALPDHHISTGAHIPLQIADVWPPARHAGTGPGYVAGVAIVRLLDADQAPLLARPYYADGDPGPIVGALAQVPELLETALPFIGAALGPSALSWRVKELVIVRTSALLRCRYCVQTHTAVALDAGLSRAEILALRERTPLDEAFTESAELALLRWVDVVAVGPGQVPADVRADMAKHWADHEIVEATVTIGATVMLNRFATSLGLPTSAATARRLAAEDLL